MPRKVIVIGADVKLVESRAMVLRSRDYQAVCGSESDALILLKGGPYDLLLLCSSLSAKSASQVGRRGKSQLPDIRILRLVAEPSPESETQIMDAMVRIDYDPLTWLHAIDRLLGLNDQADGSA